MLPGPVDFEEYEPVPATKTRAAEEPVAAPLFADEVAEDEAPTGEEPGRRRVKKERTPLALPVINPRVAAVITGLLVGVAGVLLSFGASQGCESVRGVGSCGGIGLFALLAVLLIEVLLGSYLLKAWRLPDPTSTSFLGVGLVAVMALLFFLDSLDSVWMLLVIPVLTAITFLVSWWVTETFVEETSGDNLHR